MTQSDHLAIRIRQARTADAAQIAGFWNPMIRETTITFTTEEKTAGGLAAQIGRMQADGHGACVAVRDDRVLGYACYGAFRSGPGYARSAEHTIVLAPGARGQGTGRALMTRLEAQAAAAGIHLLVAGISGENAAAQDFHARLGYERCGLVREAGFKFGRYLDLVLMQKILT